jgi:putative spermidine/putrescine transport system substrate-binding protein
MNTLTKLKLGLAGLAIGLTAAVPANAEKLTLSSSGGQVAQLMQGVFTGPFTKETGIEVEYLATTDRASAIKAMVLAGNTIWDVTELNAIEYATASLNGWLEPLDWAKIDPNNMLPDSAKLGDAGIAATYSNVLSIRTDKAEGKEMSSWAEFWDVENFPGPRSLQNQPFDNLEFALQADGVAKEDLYTVLSTPEGIDRAFAKLDEIKPHIVVWWTTGAQPIQMLADGEVHYTSAFNGRLTKMAAEGQPVKIVWNGGAVKPSYVAVPKGTLNREAADAFLTFMLTSPERAAGFASYAPYPFFTKGLYDLLPPEKGIVLPTHPDNLEQQFVSNDLWWGAHYADLNERWQDWVLE